MRKDQSPLEQLEALSEIRGIMERSTRFLSLSGWSGVWAGLMASSGCIIAHAQLNNYYRQYNERGGFDQAAYLDLRNQLFYLGITVFVLALSGAFLFTLRKVRQQNADIWGPASRRFLYGLAIPVAAGAVMVLAFLHNNHMEYVAPACLLFYGLGLYNAGKFTLDDIRYLGLIEILLGAICLFAPDLGLYFWGFGFGLMHIVYGIIMWNKYDRRS
ncbi:hypothetical protein [Rurimicrobium arvi]|uniref:DUF998 domain-containing protein n=1 Tax=Rurimicrobium arvi TaxID=2049916 RepID=A0ABP8MHV5_9BACT